MNASIWNELSQHIPTADKTFIDLGFTGTKPQTHIPSYKPAIYITHSLGTLWALKHQHASMDALIAINGFSSFKSFSDERTLQMMQKRLKTTPIRQMKAFWKTCSIPQNIQNTLDPTLNIDRLHTGLDWLADWDETARLQTLSVPILALAGQKDLVLPIDMMKKEWHANTLEIQSAAGHALPLSHPEWCEQKIKEFIRGIELEK